MRGKAKRKLLFMSRDARAASAARSKDHGGAPSTLERLALGGLWCAKRVQYFKMYYVHTLLYPFYSPFTLEFYTPVLSSGFSSCSGFTKALKPGEAEEEGDNQGRTYPLSTTRHTAHAVRARACRTPNTDRGH